MDVYEIVINLNFGGTLIGSISKQDIDAIIKGMSADTKQAIVITDYGSGSDIIVRTTDISYCEVAPFRETAITDDVADDLFGIIRKENENTEEDE